MLPIIIEMVIAFGLIGFSFGIGYRLGKAKKLLIDSQNLQDTIKMSYKNLLEYRVNLLSSLEELSDSQSTFYEKILGETRSLDIILTELRNILRLRDGKSVKVFHKPTKSKKVG